MTDSRNAMVQHLLADLFGITPERLADGEALSELLQATAERSGSNPITVPIVIPSRAVTPARQAGVTGFIVLAESHIAFHSDPELGFLAVDVFTCGPNAQPEAALNVFVERLQPKQTVRHNLMRGVIA